MFGPQGGEWGDSSPDSREGEEIGGLPPEEGFPHSWGNAERSEAKGMLSWFRARLPSQAAP